MHVPAGMAAVFLLRTIGKISPYPVRGRLSTGQGDKVYYIDDDVDGGAHECPLSVTAFRPRATFLEGCPPI